MPRSLATLTPDAHAFLAEYHLGTLTTLRRDGSPHVVAVGFTVDLAAGLARVITSAGCQKARNAERGGVAVLTQVDGSRWISLEGPARVMAEPAAVAQAVARYAQRYREPRVNPTRVAIEITISRVMGAPAMVGRAVKGAV